MFVPFFLYGAADGACILACTCRGVPKWNTCTSFWSDLFSLMVCSGKFEQTHVPEGGSLSNAVLEFILPCKIFCCATAKIKWAECINYRLYLIYLYNCRGLITVKGAISYSASLQTWMTKWLCFLRGEHMAVMHVILFTVLIRELPVYPQLISLGTNSNLLRL